ncbi:PadR family transcriptional regulator [Janthinobacterium sp. RB2R34]|uniref:PadR family transcriptional regulator n=1 Tax=Janthinobacterium sp. RB2R34 TaxID=3424193 RepID=UPI003F228B33
MRNSHHTEQGHCGHYHHHDRHTRIEMHGRGPRGFDGGERGDGMGPGGPGGRGGRGERAERVFGRGDLPLIVLALIEISPRHGYEIIKAIEERCAGAYAPSPGAVYPTLTLLEEQDQVTASDSGSGKKLYTITELGRTHLDTNRAQVDGIFARLDMVARMQARRALPERLHQAMHTLKHALLLNKTSWSEEQTERVAAILEKAANDIVDGH